MMIKLRLSLPSLVRSAAFLVFLSSVLFAKAQKIDLKQVELADNKVIFHYDLIDSNPSHEYAISIFSSKDDFTAPLVKVTGDIGNEVIPGENKSIVWEISQELGRFVGSLEFQIKAKVFVPFLKLSEFDSKKKYKRGKSYPLLWTSGNMSGQVDIELYVDQTRIASDRNVPNTGKFDWFIPSNVKPGRNYHIKFTNTKKREETIESAVFRIAPKFPKAFKAILLAAVGGTAALVGSLDGGGTVEVEPDLPFPPDNK